MVLAGSLVRAHTVGAALHAGRLCEGAASRTHVHARGHKGKLLARGIGART